MSVTKIFIEKSKVYYFSGERPFWKMVVGMGGGGAPKLFM